MSLDHPFHPTTESTTAPGEVAEIFDRGYRRYDGERTGSKGAMRAVVGASVQRALGLRRKFRFKVVPILTAVIAYVPAFGFLAFAILIPNDFLLEAGDAEEYAGYFGLIAISLVLFTAFVAPELMSTDRETGMLGLYLAGPLSRWQYLVAKAAALMSVMLIVTLFPIVFLLVGYLLVGLGPEGFGDTARLVGRILLSGALTAMYFTLIGMAVASLTRRKGFASAGIVVLLLASVALTEILVEAAEAPDWVLLLGLLRLPAEMATRVFNEPGEQIEGVATITSLGIFGLVCAVAATICVVVYRRLEVSK